MGFETYIVENTNGMYRLFAKAEAHPDEDNEVFIEVAVIGCQTLQRLATDPDFGRTVETLYAGRFDERQRLVDEYRSAIDDMEQFN